MVELAPGTRGDLIHVLRWNAGAGEEFLTQWAGPVFTAPLTEEQLLRLWGPAIERRTEQSRFYRIVDRSLTEEPIGVIELAAIDPRNGTARVARFLIGEPGARGKGTGTEVLRSLLAICFDELDLHRVSLAVFDFNEQAIRCYEKVGFRKEGLIREARRVGDDYWSYYEMAVLRQEWEAGNEPARVAAD